MGVWKVPVRIIRTWAAIWNAATSENLANCKPPILMASFCINYSSVIMALAARFIVISVAGSHALAFEACACTRSFARAAEHCSQLKGKKMPYATASLE